MAVKKNTTSEIKILRQETHNINGYTYSLDGSDFVASSTSYFKKNRCLDLPNLSTNEFRFDLDNMNIYNEFVNDIENIQKGIQVKSLKGFPTTNLTLTILDSEVDLNKEFEDFTKNNKKGAINSHLAETLNYLFGNGDTKQKTKRIIESIKKNNSGIAGLPKLEQKLFDEDGNIIVKKKRGRKKTEEILLLEPIEKKKRGRPPLRKIPFRVFVPDKMKSGDSADEESLESMPAPSESAPSSVASRPPTRKRRPTSAPKLKKFSAFADSYTPLNQVENSEVVEYLNLEVLPQSLLATVKTEFTSDSRNAKITKKELIEQSFIRLYQSVLLAKMRYENGDKNSRVQYETDICKIYVNLMCELLKKLGIPEDQELVDEYFKGVVFDNNEEKYKHNLKGEQSVFEGRKVADNNKSLDPSEVILNITSEKSKPLVNKLLTVGKLDEHELPTVLVGNVLLKLNEYEDRKTFDKIVLVTKEILSEGPKASSYYQFLSFVASNLLPDQSNLEDIKTKIPFDLLFLSDSDIKDQEKVNLVKIFAPLKLQIDLAKESPNKKDETTNLQPKSYEEMKDAKAENPSTSSESTDFFELNELFSDSVLKKLGLRDFNGRTSEDLKMEAKYNELRTKALAEGMEITEDEITNMINQVAKDEANLLFLQGSQKMKKGRKIKKNYVLPPKPLANSATYTQEIKKYNAAKDYLRDPANTSLRVVCQQNKISVPTLITYMDAGRVSRMLITGRYSGSTVIRDSSFNNRGKSLYPDEIKGVFLQKTYEQLLEAKKSSLKCDIPKDSKISARLSIAKHDLLEELKNNLVDAGTDTTNKEESVDLSHPSSSLADVSGNLSITTTATGDASAVQKYLTNRVDKLSVKYPVLRLPYQETFANDVLRSETKAGLADIIKSPILSMVEKNSEIAKEIDFEYLSSDCVYSMSNTVAAIVDSNFDFASFLGGVFKKKKSNLFKKNSVQPSASKPPSATEGSEYSKNKSCFKLIQFKET